MKIIKRYYDCNVGLCSFVIFMCSSFPLISSGEGNDKSKPSIVVKVRQGERVLLPCYINNIVYKDIKWWKNEDLIAESSAANESATTTIESNQTVQIGNYKLHVNKTLEIIEVTLEDDANYTCQVERFEPWKPINQTTTVQVLFPPRITIFPDLGIVDVEKGKEVVLTCMVSGQPKPTIRWYHEEKEIELVFNRESLNIDKVSLKIAGLYQCIASNNIGESTSKSFNVNVIYKPELSVDKKWIHSAPDMRAEIICDVFSNPLPKMEWYRNGVIVTMGGRIDMHISSEKYKLIIRQVKDTDFGNYTCKASNLLGSSEQTIQLSGIPNTPIFKKSSRKLAPDSYRFVWQVDSYSNIIQYVFKFREREEDAPWKKMTIPADTALAGPIYTQSYNLTGLQLYTQYETIIMARNKFGWSRFSKPYIFATEGADFNADYDEQTNEDSSYTITDVTGELVHISDNEVSSKLSNSSPAQLNLWHICWSLLVVVIVSTICTGTKIT